MNGSDVEMKNNLMCVLKDMEVKVSQLEEVVSLSEQVLDKFNNPRQLQRPEKQEVVEAPEQNSMNLLGLFDKVIDGIDNATNRIEINLKKIQEIVG